MADRCTECEREWPTLRADKALVGLRFTLPHGIQLCTACWVRGEPDLRRRK